MSDLPKRQPGASNPPQDMKDTQTPPRQPR